MPSATAPTPTATHRTAVNESAGMYQLTVIKVTERTRKAAGATINANMYVRRSDGRKTNASNSAYTSHCQTPGNGVSKPSPSKLRKT